MQHVASFYRAKAHGREHRNDILSLYIATNGWDTDVPIDEAYAVNTAKIGKVYHEIWFTADARKL